MKELNPLCESCQKECKQDKTVIVVKCPNYVPIEKKDAKKNSKSDSESTTAS